MVSELQRKITLIVTFTQDRTRDVTLCVERFQGHMRVKLCRQLICIEIHKFECATDHVVYWLHVSCCLWSRSSSPPTELYCWTNALPWLSRMSALVLPASIRPSAIFTRSSVRLAEGLPTLRLIRTSSLGFTCITHDPIIIKVSLCSNPGHGLPTKKFHLSIRSVVVSWKYNKQTYEKTKHYLVK